VDKEVMFVIDKNWYRSLTVWGTILMIAAFVLGQFGFTFTAEQQAQIAQLLVVIATAVGELIGIILVITGRRKAGKEIKMLRLAKGIPAPSSKGDSVANFFIELFRKIFGKDANAVMSGAMFIVSSDGRELFSSIKKALGSEKGKILIEQLQKLNEEEAKP